MLPSREAATSDVFVSYNGLDRPVVSRLCERLRAKDLAPFFDRWSLTPGRNWQGELLNALDAHASIAVCLGPAGLGDWQKLEIDFALTRHAREGAGFPVIPVLLPGVDPSKLGLGFLTLATWVDFRDEGEAGLDTLVAAIRGQPPGPDARLAADARAQVNPYRGLEFFREEDAPFFFGRDAFSDEVARAVIEAKLDASLVAIVGDSGSGKSSIAQAGLLPRLRDPARARPDDGEAGPSSGRAARHKPGTLWSVLAMSPGEKPVDRLAELLTRRFELPPAEHEAQFVGIRRALLAPGEDERGALGRFAGRLVDEDRRIDRMLLLVDQFEEVFTLATPETAPAAERFVEELVRAARDPSVPLTVVVTLRADQYHHVTNRRLLAALVRQGQVTVGPLERAELRRAVEEPAKTLGARFEAGLVERILDDVGNEPGALPLLEYALDLLWARRDPVSGALTHAAYEKIGGVRRAIAARADEVYGRLSPEEQAAAQAVLLRLVRPGEGTLDSKRPGTVEEADAPAARALAALCASRLVVAGEGRIEITHEALIREWSTLRAWIDAKREALSLRQRLDAEARHWEDVARRDPEAAATLLLSPGLRLEEGRQLLAESGGLLVGFPEARRFIEASVATDVSRMLAERGRAAAEVMRAQEQALAEADLARERASAEAERRRGRRLAIGGLLIALMFAGLCGGALLLWADAERARQAAETASAEAVRQKAEAVRLQGVAEANEHRAAEQADRAEQQSGLAKLRATEAEQEKAEAHRQRRIAEDQATLAQQREAEAQQQKLRAEVEKARADRALAAGIKTVDTLMSDLVQKFKNYGVPKPVLQAMLDRVLKLQADLAAGREDDARLERSRLVALINVGDVLVARNDLPGALKAYEESRAIAAKLAAADPSNAEAARDLAVSLNKVGDVLVLRNDLTGALKAYEESRAITAKLAAADPSNAAVDRDLSVSLNKAGDVRVAQGDLAGALKAYEESRAITAKLAAADPSNAAVDRDLSVSLNKAGDVRVAQGDLAGALKAYEEGRAITAKLAAADPSNAEAARDLALSLNRVGDVRKARNDLPGALKAYEEGRAITAKLAAADPSNAEAARDLALSLNRVGDVRKARNDLPGALKAYEEGRAITAKLAATDPSNAQAARDLAVSLNRVGDVRKARNDLPGALKAYEEGRAIAERLAAADPSNAEAARDLSVSLNKVGDARVAPGDLAGALKAYEEGRAIAERLAAADPSNAQAARDLAVSLEGVGDVLVARNDLAGALKGYEAGKVIREKLAAADPSNAQAARDLSVSLLKIGSVLRQANQTAGACRYDLDSRANLRAYRARSGQPEAFASDVAWLDRQIAELRCDEAAWTAGRLGQEVVEAVRAGDYARALGAPGAAPR